MGTTVERSCSRHETTPHRPAAPSLYLLCACHLKGVLGRVDHSDFANVGIVSAAKELYPPRECEGGNSVSTCRAAAAAAAIASRRRLRTLTTHVGAPCRTPRRRSMRSRPVSSSYVLSSTSMDTTCGANWFGYLCQTASTVCRQVYGISNLFSKERGIAARKHGR